MYRCVICDLTLNSTKYFCKKCYATYFDDISQKKPWVKALINLAQRERMVNRHITTVSIEYFQIDSDGKAYVSKEGNQVKKYSKEVWEGMAANSVDNISRVIEEG